MSNNKKQIAEKILTTLGKQRFADWYNTGAFDAWISGRWPSDDKRQPNTSDILRDIEVLFDL